MIKLFQTPMVDQLKWTYPQALVAIHQVKLNSITTLTANYENNRYDEDHEPTNTIAYCANWWMDQNTKQQGLTSRPVINPDAEDEENMVFSFDVGDMAEVFDRAPGDDNQKILACCEHHFKTDVTVKLRG